MTVDLSDLSDRYRKRLRLNSPGGITIVTSNTSKVTESDEILYNDLKRIRKYTVNTSTYDNFD